MTTVRRETDGRYVYLPEGFDAPAETPLDALLQGRALLVEEGRWIKRAAFRNPHPEEDPTTPFCDGWGACAIGALYCVTIGIRHGGVTSKGCGSPNCTVCGPAGIPVWLSDDFNGDPKARQAYATGHTLLNEAVRRTTHFGFTSVVDYNDHSQTTHERVLEVFDNAIATVQREAEAVSNS